MSYFKFEDDDIIFNTLKAHPECHFYLYQNAAAETKLIYNNRKEVLGAFASTYNVDLADDQFPKNVRHVPSGFVSLYEMNIDRPFNESTNAPDTVYPFITKDGSMASFSTVSTADYNNDFAYGDQITGSYPLSASISIQRIPAGPTPTGQVIDMSQGNAGRHRLKRDALRSSFKFNTRLSKRFSYDRGLDELGLANPSWEQNNIQMVQIPSIFYGEKIKKGTVKLDWYKEGKLHGTVEDPKQNGELNVTYSTNEEAIGTFVGVVFYSEGFILLVDNGPGSVIYEEDGIDEVSIDGQPATWMDFMRDLDDYHEDALTNTDLADPAPEAAVSNEIGPNSFSLYFKGTNTIPTLTLMAELERDECTHSNNSTFIDSDYDWYELDVIENVTGNHLGVDIGQPRFRVSATTPIPARISTEATENPEYMEGRIEGFVGDFSCGGCDPFAGKELFFKRVDTDIFEVYRRNDAGEIVYDAASDMEIDVNDQGSMASFSVKASAYARQQVLQGASGYIESNSLKIKNTVKSDFDDPFAEYEDHTYISKIAIYDDDKNLIGIAKLATPVKKTLKRDFTFKLKIDL